MRSQSPNPDDAGKPPAADWGDVVDLTGPAQYNFLNEGSDQRRYQFSSSLTCAEEELVCESVAYTVCGSIGLDTSGYSIPYLASWSQEADIEAVERAATTIDRIARRIEDSIGEPPGQRESFIDPATLGGDASLTIS